MGVTPMELAERLVELLSPPRQRTKHRLPRLPVDAPKRHTRAQAVEAVIQPHGGEPQDAKERGPSKIKAYWAKMTVEERKAEWKKRFKKWDPEAKKKWHKGK